MPIKTKHKYLSKTNVSSLNIIVIFDELFGTQHNIFLVVSPPPPDGMSTIYGPNCMSQDCLKCPEISSVNFERTGVTQFYLAYAVKDKLRVFTAL